MINVQQLSYRIGPKKIVDNISFEARPGEITAIIGANGAGKSTLLKLLCREIIPVTGTVMLRGKDLNSYSLKELARMRSVLTQHNTISVSFTAMDLVLMGRYPHFENQPSAHDLQMVEQAMHSVGITHLRARSYETLSGGEQQRVQLARVIAQIQDMSGAWLFLDEPTNGLDLLHQQQLLLQARAMADEGYGVICILHDINLAAAYADQILLLKNGKQLVAGPPKEVISAENIYEAFGLKVQLLQHENFKCPLVVTGGTFINFKSFKQWK